MSRDFYSFLLNLAECSPDQTTVCITQKESLEASIFRLFFFVGHETVEPSLCFFSLVMGEPDWIDTLAGN